MLQPTILNTSCFTTPEHCMNHTIDVLSTSLTSSTLIGRRHRTFHCRPGLVIAQCPAHRHQMLGKHPTQMYRKQLKFHSKALLQLCQRVGGPGHLGRYRNAQCYSVPLCVKMLEVAPLDLRAHSSTPGPVPTLQRSYHEKQCESRL